MLTMNGSDKLTRQLEAREISLAFFYSDHNLPKELYRWQKRSPRT